MMTLAAFLLAATLLAAAAALYADIERIRSTVARRRRKLAAALEMRNRSIGAMDLRLQRVQSESADLRTELQSLQEQVAKAEVDLQRIEQSPRDMLIVFDKASLSREKLWEVRIANPEFAARAAKEQSADRLMTGWREGRIYLLGAASAAEAKDRCAARFPAHLGFQVLDAVASRLDAARSAA